MSTLSTTHPYGVAVVLAVSYTGQTAAQGSSGSPISLFTADTGGTSMYRLTARVKAGDPVSFFLKESDHGGATGSIDSTFPGSGPGQADEILFTTGSGDSVGFYTTVTNSNPYDLYIVIEKLFGPA